MFCFTLCPGKPSVGFDRPLGRGRSQRSSPPSSSVRKRHSLVYLLTVAPQFHWLIPLCYLSIPSSCLFTCIYPVFDVIYSTVKYCYYKFNLTNPCLKLEHWGFNCFTCHWKFSRTCHYHPGASFKSLKIKHTLKLFH